MEFEIVHSGIKGMRWGFRRYQNRDGTLTAAGKKRYNKELAKVREQEKTLKNKKATQAKFDRLEARKKAVEEGNRALDGDKKRPEKPKPDVENKKEAPKPKTINDLSDQELQSVVLRLRNEKAFKELTAQEPKVSKGRKFINGLFGKVVVPVAEDVGKNVLKRGLENLTGDVFRDGKNKGPGVTKTKKDSKTKSEKTSNSKVFSGDVIDDIFGGSNKGSGKSASNVYDDIIDVDFTDVTPSSARSSSTTELGGRYILSLLEKNP